MKKFFVVGKEILLLGREFRKNNFKFSIGKNLFDQTDFAEVKKIDKYFIVKKSIINKAPSEAFFLLFKVIEKNFSKSYFFFQKEIVDQVIEYEVKRKFILKKYPKLTDVYENPLLVPWNFMPIEVEDILSFYDKDSIKNKKILYIGAGYGKNIWALREKKYDISAIEYSNKAVKRANAIFGKKVIMSKDIIKYIEKDKYDVILDIGCLHSISKPERKKAVENIHKLLKKDGILISRIFKSREKDWLNRMPFKTNCFGLDNEEINELFKSFLINYKYNNKDYIIVEAKK